MQRTDDRRKIDSANAPALRPARAAGVGERARPAGETFVVASRPMSGPVPAARPAAIRRRASTSSSCSSASISAACISARPSAWGPWAAWVPVEGGRRPPGLLPWRATPRAARVRTRWVCRGRSRHAEEPRALRPERWPLGGKPSAAHGGRSACRCDSARRGASHGAVARWLEPPSARRRLQSTRLESRVVRALRRRDPRRAWVPGVRDAAGLALAHDELSLRASVSVPAVCISKR
jgi:hypothetical protein